MRSTSYRPNLISRSSLEELRKFALRSDQDHASAADHSSQEGRAQGTFGSAPPQDQANSSQDGTANNRAARYLAAGLEQEQDDRERQHGEPPACPHAAMIALPIKQFVEPIETEAVRRKDVRQARDQAQAGVYAGVADTAADGILIRDAAEHAGCDDDQRVGQHEQRPDDFETDANVRPRGLLRSFSPRFNDV